jgi:Fur family transcriptional regulator, ferric uptake regulator
MTIARTVPAQAAPTLAAALGAVRAHGLRVSAIRRQLLAILYAEEGPVSVERLARRLTRGDRGSVYRNLECLEAIGLVRHVHLGHGPGMYTLAGRAESEFVTCERCGAFEPVAPARLDAVRALIEQELGYRPRFTHFPIVGVCAACA